MLQRIGRYEILERIATGGQGTVYRARDTTLDRVVAVKVIDQPVTDDPGYLKTLQREARLATGLTHLEIVLDRCVRHDLVDEPLHDPEFFGEAFAGNLHGDVTDARFAVSL